MRKGSKEQGFDWDNHDDEGLFMVGGPITRGFNLDDRDSEGILSALFLDGERERERERERESKEKYF